MSSKCHFNDFYGEFIQWNSYEKVDSITSRDAKLPLYYI